MAGPANAAMLATSRSANIVPSGSTAQSDDTTQTITGTTGAVTVESNPAPTPSPDELQSLAATFTCDLNVQNPHPSTHVDGTINVVATITCQIAAAHLRLATSLIRVSPNTAEWSAGTVNNDNSASIQNNAAASCSQGPGTFKGWGWGTITAPPGYTLSGSADYDKYGNTVNVICGGATLAATPAAAAGQPSGLQLQFVRSDLAKTYTYEQLTKP